MTTVVFFLEEPSAKEMLDAVVPRLLPEGCVHQCIHFSGKQDLERNLVRKLKGWQKPDSVFVVLRDQDAGDCREIKRRLNELCVQAGRGSVLVRIACHELESFYLGDLAAVEKGLEIVGLASKQGQAKFRDPDTLANPSEELRRLTNKGYQKLLGSRAISPHLDLDANKSRSFNTLLSGLRRLVADSC